MDGREVLREMKSDAALRRIPVVVLTTSDAETDVVRSYDLHANCYITKPLDIEQFIRVVKGIDDFWFGIVRPAGTYRGTSTHGGIAVSGAIRVLIVDDSSDDAGAGRRGARRGGLRPAVRAGGHRPRMSDALGPRGLRTPSSPTTRCPASAAWRR